MVTKFGKYEPTGTQRYVTLFDSTSQVLLDQIQVSGPAATLSYGDLPSPRWLNAFQSYLITVHLQTGDQYYISSNTGAGPHINYTRTGWCNTCSENTFPLNATTGHFGYPDFEYYVRDSAGVYPTYQLGQDLTANVGGDVDYCLGDSTQLEATIVGGYGAQNLAWNPPASVSNTTITNPWTYANTPSGNIVFGVQDALGCISKDTLVLTVNVPLQVNIGQDTTICFGPIQLDAGIGFINFEWQDMSSGNTFTATIAGTYHVTTVDVNNCMTSDTVIIDPAPVVDLGLDTNLCNGPVLLDAGPGMVYYQWQDMSTGQTHLASTPGNYFVDVSDSYNCQVVDSIFVDDCASLDELGDGMVLVQPNPITTKTTVQFGQFQESIEINIRDINGKLVFAKAYKEVEAIDLDFTALQSGTYFIQLEGENLSTTVKVIKQ